MAKSKIVTGKMYRITITGEVPPGMMAEDHEMVTAAMMGAVSLSLGLVGTVTKVDCSLGELRPAQPPPGNN